MKNIILAVFTLFIFVGCESIFPDPFYKVEEVKIKIINNTNTDAKIVIGLMDAAKPYNEESVLLGKIEQTCSANKTNYNTFNLKNLITANTDRNIGYELIIDIKNKNVNETYLVFDGLKLMGNDFWRDDYKPYAMAIYTINENGVKITYEY